MKLFLLYESQFRVHDILDDLIIIYDFSALNCLETFGPQNVREN